jgi:hypothetical protein
MASEQVAVAREGIFVRSLLSPRQKMSVKH